MSRWMAVHLVWLILPNLGWTQPAAPGEFLPLAVGDSWTYQHTYVGNERGKETVTISITHTEEIDGHRYFVFSAMPYEWPPVPYFFLAGKKVRLAADGRLMERRPDGETFLFHFGLGHRETYSLAESEPDTVVRKHDTIVHGVGKSTIFSFWGDYNFFESEMRDGPVKRAISSSLPAEGFSSSFEPEFRSAMFRLGLGLYRINISIVPDDYPILENNLFLDYAIINGQRLRYIPGLGVTGVAPTSWGRLKHLFPPY